MHERGAVAIQTPHTCVRLGEGDAIPALISALNDPEPVVRTAVIAAMGRIQDRQATCALISCLKDTDDRVRIGAAEVLGKLGDSRAIKPLEALEQDPFSDVREAAEMAVSRIQKKTNSAR